MGYNEKADSLLLHLVAESFEGCRAKDSVWVYFKHDKNTTQSISALHILNTWPNPVESQLNWSLKAEAPLKLSLTLSDSRSVPVIVQTLDRYTPGSIESLNMSSLAAGNYLLSIKAGEDVYTRKIIKK